MKTVGWVEFLISIGVYNIVTGILHYFTKMEMIPSSIAFMGVFYLLVAWGLHCYANCTKDDEVKDGS